MEGKPSIEVPTSELPIQRTATEAAIHSIVFLNRYPHAKSNLVRLPNRTSTRRISQELFSAGEIRARHETILETLADVPTYDLHYQRLSDGIRALDDLITKI